jgi:hypothetical protein
VVHKSGQYRVERSRTPERPSRDQCAAALRERRLSESLAFLAAQIGMAAFGHAAREWRTSPSHDLRALLAQSFDDIHTLS